MKIPPILLAFAVTASTVFADATITQEVQVEGGPMAVPKQTMIMKLKGDYLRTDMLETQASIIVDSKSGDTTTLSHQQKMAMTVPGATMKQMGQKAMQSPEAEKHLSGTGDLKATGKKETINGFACEEYLGTMGESKINYWLCNNVPAQEAMTKQLSSITRNMDTSTIGPTDLTKMPGFPIRTIMVMPGGGKVTTTILKISGDELSESDFKVPADYKTMAMPAGMGAPGH